MSITISLGKEEREALTAQLADKLKSCDDGNIGPAFFGAGYAEGFTAALKRLGVKQAEEVFQEANRRALQ